VTLARSFTALIVLAVASGCGGKSTPPAESPSGSTGAPASTTAGPSTGPAVGISDAPTGEGSAQRPAMNAAAAQAYTAGIQAFKVGDLPGARTQFTRATQSDPKAYQAFYSLGVVQERLNEVSNALASYRQATVIVADYEPAIFAYAVLLARGGKGDQATEYLNGRMAAMPKSAAVSAALGEVKSIQGDSGAAQRLPQESARQAHVRGHAYSYWSSPLLSEVAAATAPVTSTRLDSTRRGASPIRVATSRATLR